VNPPGDYRIAFTAVAPRPVDAAAAALLDGALRAMPGIDVVEAIAPDDGQRRVNGAFWIQVRLGMADAARDGSRLAKEALKVAGMADTQLVELSVSLREEPAPS
jgi:hypothetical protein